jgi:hypothetical protein
MYISQMPVKQYRSGFSSSSRAGFITGYQTTQNQGGGEKKAGLIPSVGNDSWASRFRKITDPKYGRCCGKTGMAVNMFYTKNTVRPVDTRPGLAMR